MNNDPKHKQLTDRLRAAIMDGTYPEGKKIPSENELSRTLSVSRQTVRQALENEGLLSRVRGSGTFVQAVRRIKTNKTRRIGVVITYLDDYVFPAIVQGIETVLSGHDYTLSLGITYNKVENERKALLQMLGDGVDGLIIEGTKSALPNPNIALYERIKKENLPFIFINGYYEKAGNGYVILDDIRAGEAICGELIKNGHTSIGGLFKSDDMQGHKRYQGFTNQLNRHGLTMHDEAVLWYTTEDIAFLFGGNMDDVILKRLDSVTGIVCYNDQIAIKLIDLLRRHERNIPEHYSIVSVDNSALAASTAYNLTSFEYPAFMIGKQAAGGLLRLLGGSQNRMNVKLDGQLFLRGSVKRLGSINNH